MNIFGLSITKNKTRNKLLQQITDLELELSRVKRHTNGMFVNYCQFTRFYEKDKELGPLKGKVSLNCGNCNKESATIEFDPDGFDDEHSPCELKINGEIYTMCGDCKKKLEEKVKE